MIFMGQSEGIIPLVFNGEWAREDLIYLVRSTCYA
jgi:hypothetical protein